MTHADRLERCCLCDEPTGKAGAGDGSIYWSTPNGELGPLCDACNDALREHYVADAGAAALREVARLRAALAAAREREGDARLCAECIVEIVSTKDAYPTHADEAAARRILAHPAPAPATLPDEPPECGLCGMPCTSGICICGWSTAPAPALSKSQVKRLAVQNASEQVACPECPRCPKCGYTDRDARYHMDHRLCGAPAPAPCPACGGGK